MKNFFFGPHFWHHFFKIFPIFELNCLKKGSKNDDLSRYYPTILYIFRKNWHFLQKIDQFLTHFGPHFGSDLPKNRRRFAFQTAWSSHPDPNFWSKSGSKNDQKKWWFFWHFFQNDPHNFGVLDDISSSLKLSMNVEKLCKIAIFSQICQIYTILSKIDHFDPKNDTFFIKNTAWFRFFNVFFLM